MSYHGLWRLLTVVPLYCSEKYMKRFYFFLKKSKVWLTMDVHEILRESVSVCGCMCMWTGSYLIITSGRFSCVPLWEEVLDFSTLIDVLCWWSSFSSVTMTLRLSVSYAGSGTILQMLTGTAHPCCFSLNDTFCYPENVQEMQLDSIYFHLLLFSLWK